MKAFLQSIWSAIRHNPYMIIAMIFLLLFLLWLFGCEPTVISPFDPTKNVTRAELQIDFDAYFQRVQLANEQLTKKEQLRDLLINQAFVIAENGMVNPVALLTSAFSILGIGSVLDNRRKDKVIDEKSKALEDVNKANA